VSALLGKTGYKNLDQPGITRGKRRIIDRDTTRKPVLIACPSAVLFNWKREFETWGFFNVEIFHGGRKKDQALHNINAGFSEILITTFETLRINKDVLDSVDWDLLIVDEVWFLCFLRIQRRRKKELLLLSPHFFRLVSLLGSQAQGS